MSASASAVAAVAPVGARLRCREISADDVDEVADLLARGFRAPLWKQLLIRRQRSPGRDFWRRAFKRLSIHPTPPGFPRYGYLLEAQGKVVAAVLLIASVVEVGGEQRVRCNVSSWYAEPEFRCYATMLAARTLHSGRATYFNVTPSRRTLDILSAQGFEQYCAGHFFAVPARPRRFDARPVDVVAIPPGAAHGLSSIEMELMAAHADYGCITLICRAGGDDHPFVFLPLRQGRLPGFVHLAYCRRLEDFVQFSGPLGRFLLRRGFPFVILDANGPIGGLFGKYSFRYPKYFKGPDCPRLGDIAYSERVMFGF